MADMMSSIMLIPIGFLRCLHPTTHGEKLFWNIYEVVLFLPLANTFITSSVWITLIISVERCVFIQVFAGARDVFSPQRTRIIVLTTFLVSTIFNLPFFFKYDLYKTMASNKTEPIRTDFAKSVYFNVWSWIRLALVKYIPITTVTISNAILIRATWLSMSKTRLMQTTYTLQRRTQKQTKMTKMLLSISTVFIVCHALEPFIQSEIYQTMFGECSHHSSDYHILLLVVTLAEAVSFASNFISYCSFNRCFTLTLKKLLRCEPNIVGVEAGKHIATVGELCSSTPT